MTHKPYPPDTHPHLELRLDHIAERILNHISRLREGSSVAVIHRGARGGLPGREGRPAGHIGSGVEIGVWGPGIGEGGSSVNVIHGPR